MDDEQAVNIERDFTLDDDDEQFTSRGIYGKFKKNEKEKKRIKREAAEAEDLAIVEERREWNIAMQNAKNKVLLNYKEVVPYDKN